jgi:hypothetical protein
MLAWLSVLRGDDAFVTPEPAASPDVVAAATSALGRPAVEWAVQLAARIIDERTAGAARLPAGPEIDARRGCESGLLHGLTQFALGVPPEEVGACDVALYKARSLARADVPIDGLIRMLWDTHAKVVDAFFGAVSRQPAGPDVIAQIREMNMALTTYVSNTVRDMLAAYEDEVTTTQSGEHAAIALALRHLLDSGTIPLAVESTLSMRLHGAHLVGLAWWTVDRPDDGHRLLNRFAAQLCEMLGGHGGAAIHVEPHEVLWLTFPNVRKVELTQVGEVERPAGLAVAFGSVGEDVEGLRLSYRQALEASRLGQLSRMCGSWTYDETALVALALSDVGAAQMFVTTELDGVLGAHPRLADVRETVRVFLATGGSRAMTARSLNIAPTTVAYRVSRFEELRGRQLSSRTFETFVALELLRHVPELAGQSTSRRAGL